MRVGNAPISWGVCEIPGWGPQLPYERVLDEMARAGYEGTELGPWGYLPTDPERLAQLLESRGLALAASFVPVNLRERGRLEEERPNVEAVAKLLRFLGRSPHPDRRRGRSFADEYCREARQDARRRG